MKFVQPFIPPNAFTRKTLGAVNMSKVVSIRKSRFTMGDSVIMSIVFELDDRDWGSWCYREETTRDLVYEALMEEVE